MSAALIEQIKDDLGYLKLHRSAEVFATLADAARRDDQSHLEFLAALVAEEAAATRQRRLSARLRFAHFPTRRSLEDFDFSFQPSIDPKVIADLAGWASWKPAHRFCSWESRGAGSPIWPSPWPSWRSKPATGATSPPPQTWWRP